MARPKAQTQRKSASAQGQQEQTRRGRRPLRGAMENVGENVSERLEKITRELRSDIIGTGLLVGVGSYFIGRYLIRYYKDHPEIGEFFSSNYQNVAERIRGGIENRVSEEATRH